MLQVLANNNLIIQARNKTSQIHMDNAMPYFTDEAHELDTIGSSHTDQSQL